MYASSILQIYGAFQNWTFINVVSSILKRFPLQNTYIAKPDVLFHDRFYYETKVEIPTSIYAFHEIKRQNSIVLPSAEQTISTNLFLFHNI